LSALRDIFGRTVVKLDFEPLTAARLHSEATICAPPGLGVLFGSCSPVQLIHPRELADDDDLSIMIGPWKKWTAAMMGRNPVLGSGDGVMMWNAEVGSMTVPSRARFVTFRVPAATIAPLVPDIGKVVAQRIPADCEALALLRRYSGSSATARRRRCRKFSISSRRTFTIFWRWRSARPATPPKSPTAAACAPRGCAPSRRILPASSIAATCPSMRSPRSIG
jgi:hypothetical protein